MPIVYRPARAEELQATQQHIVRSINDLCERHGLGPMATVRTPEFQLFCLNDDPGGLWTAEEDGQLVGSAFAWMCDDLWFLAELFISPDRQAKGIGNELLRRSLDHADARGATNKVLVTFTFNRASQTLYIRHGIYPRCPIYMFGTSRDALRRPAAPCRAQPIEGTDAQLARLGDIDRTTLGISREKHHRYLAGDTTMTGHLLFAGSDCVGYAYVNKYGHIGPLAVTRPDAVAPAFATALNLSAETGAPQVSAFIPGASEAALAGAVVSGMRITFPMLLMSSRAFGDWSRYLPRNPGFM